MSEFPLKFEEPYPVYRGLRVPVWEGGRPVSVRRVTDEDRRAFAEAMVRLRKLLEKVAKLARELGTGEEELLNLLADTIVVFLRAPLIQEVSPVAPTPLKAYALMLVAPKLREELWAQDLYAFGENLSTLSPKALEFAEELFEPETAELVYRLWIAFPADTRPGYNTSSLLAHTLMTSAIAWALAATRGGSGKELAVLRLSALLHDLGKAVNPEKHYEASEELARWLLQGILDERVLEEVLRDVREHHFRGSELREADQLASSADRLENLVEKVVKDKIERMEQLLGGSREDWGFWRRVYEKREVLAREGLAGEDPLRELTEEFLKGVAGAAKKVALHGEAREELSLVLVDVVSIQGLVMRSQEVRTVAAASHLIELIVHAHFFEFLRRNGVRVPPETVLYAGGGNVLVLLPASMARIVEGLADRYNELTKPFELVVASAPFIDFYPDATAELASRVYAEKHRVRLSSDLERWEPKGSGLCRMCYSDWATTTLSTPDGEVSVCETCKKLYEVGSEMHFRPKWGALIGVGGVKFVPKEVFRTGLEEVPWAKVSSYIMEVIAGHEPEEVLSGRFERFRDYAVVKFDGNAMGAFMLEAVSFTDAIERSFRIDMALKKAYFKALEALYEGVRKAAGGDAAEREVARVYLGTIYMGGDDGFLLAPSWAAVPLAHFIAEEFSRQLGLERGLRVAVAAGQAKMSLWALLDCAASIMEKTADVIRKHDPTAREAVLGAIAFDLFEAGSPSGASAVERMERVSWKACEKPRLRDERIDGLQPYLIRRQDLESQEIPEFWSKLAPLVVEVGVPRWSEAESFNKHVEFFRKAYLFSRAEKTEELKSLRSAILQSWSAVSGSAYWREKLLIYLRKQCAQRLEKEEKGKALREREEERLEAYRRLDRLASLSLGDRGVVPIPLADALTLIKFLKGGAW